MSSAVAEVIRRALGRVPDHVELVPTLEHNEVYRVTLGDTTVYLKTHDRHRIATESVAHARAASAGVPVPELLHTDLDGDETIGPFLVTRAAEGARLDTSGCDATLRARAFAQIAEALHRLHDVPVRGFGSFEPAALERGELRGTVDDPTARLQHDPWGLEELLREGVVDPGTVELIRRKQREGVPLFRDATPSLLHADLGTDHVYVDPASGHVTAIIDFGDARTGDVVWEFAPIAEREEHNRRALVDAYAPVDPAFEEKLDLVRLLRLVSASWWLHERGLLDAPRVETLRALARA